MEDFKMKKLPSETLNCYWIEVQTLAPKIPKEINHNGGKWLIFVSKDKVDKLWGKIRLGTIIGFLGYKSKVSTAHATKNRKSHVICVYTHDSNNKKDVMKIRKELKKLGVRQKIGYKTNRATLKGKYSKRGRKNICKYRK